MFNSADNWQKMVKRAQEPEVPALAPEAPAPEKPVPGPEKKPVPGEVPLAEPGDYLDQQKGEISKARDIVRSIWKLLTGEASEGGYKEVKSLLDAIKALEAYVSVEETGQLPKGTKASKVATMDPTGICSECVQRGCSGEVDLHDSFDARGPRYRGACKSCPCESFKEASGKCQFCGTPTSGVQDYCEKCSPGQYQKGVQRVSAAEIREVQRLGRPLTEKEAALIKKAVSQCQSCRTMEGEEENGRCAEVYDGKKCGGTIRNYQEDDPREDR